MFRNQKMQRSVAAIVLTTFISLSLYPLTAAAQAKEALEQAGVLQAPRDEGIIDNAKNYIAALAGNGANSKSQTADERFAQLLNDIHEDLKSAVPQAALPKEAKQALKGNLLNGDLVTKTRSIRAKRKNLKQLYADIEQSFKDTEQHLRNAKLPQEILDRHTQAVAQFQSRKEEFEKLMDKLEQADDSGNGADRQAALEALGGFMAKHPNAKPHQYTDPNKLPFRAPDGKVRKPYETKEEYQASLFPPKYEKVMLASLSLDGVKLAQATLPQTPAPQDLAETDDVQITQSIKDLAAQLNKDPVKIYNWVRNNIAFIPSYGSIQGSDMTLQNKRGNAFDTASLLIALYRASGIPARYVYGTIEVPTDKVMNWVGGVTKPEAAQSLLGQGGIPNVALISGGAVKAIRMEHVWVEAYVDYTPSRGAINKNPNTWVPMDASFKQYWYTKGMDIDSKVPVDSQSMVSQLMQGASVNEVEGYVQNLSRANVENQLSNYQSLVKSYIDSQNPSATAGDVLGTQKVVEQNNAILLGSLPYKAVATGNKFQTLPDNLRWKFKTNLYAADWLGDSSDPYVELVQGTPRLAGKKITLTFVPATQVDQDLINSYLPQPHADGSPIQLNELPGSLPGYLLRVNAEIRVNGQVFARTAQSFTMGGNVKQSNQYFNPSKGAWEGGADNDVTVGEANAIALDLQGVSIAQWNNLTAELDTTSSLLEQLRSNPGDVNLQQKVAAIDIRGQLLYKGILAYLASVDTNDSLSAQVNDVAFYRAPSYGRLFAGANPQIWFGIVRSVMPKGLVMDVDLLNYQVDSKDLSEQKRLAYMTQVGAWGSLYENVVIEKLLNGQLGGGVGYLDGVSTTKAMTVAAAAGQKIFLIQQDNLSSLSQVVIDSEARSEIINAAYAGKLILVHERPITVNGWAGSGYTILDPATGAGAYKISGGYNGGSTDDGYWARYLNFVSEYLPPWWLLLAVYPGLPGYKSWFGVGPALGSKNPYTTILHGISVFLQKNYGLGFWGSGMTFLTRWILFPLAVFLAAYTITILLEGFIYAMANVVPDSRNRWRLWGNKSAGKEGVLA